MSDIDPEKLEKALSLADDEIQHAKNFEYSTAEIKLANAEIIVAAARDRLAALPRFKEVDVWHVEYAQGGPSIALYTTESGAHAYADHLKKCSAFCVRVTGPHKQRVPA